MFSTAGEETQSSSPCFTDDYVVCHVDDFFGEGRYGTVKQCKRISDKKLFAVKEVRSQISDDFDKACLENLILTRLNLAKNSNIVHQEAFYKDLGKQTTHLVMEALNGMTLLETLQDESSCDQENLDEYLLGSQN